MLCRFSCTVLYLYICSSLLFLFFFFNDTATTEIYTLSLHDALPICGLGTLDAAKEKRVWGIGVDADQSFLGPHVLTSADRKSTRLNSSHDQISYAVFCLKKKKKEQ